MSDILLNSGRDFGPKMPNGMNSAVVVEVLAPVTKPNKYYVQGDPNNSKKETTQSRVVYKNAAGQVATAMYSLSLHPKSNLFKHVTGVTGGTVPPELTTLNRPWPQGLMGMQASLLIGAKPSQSGGQPWQGEILAVMPPTQVVTPPAVPVVNPAATQQGYGGAYDPTAAGRAQVAANIAAAQAQAAAYAAANPLPAQAGVPSGTDVGF